MICHCSKGLSIGVARNLGWKQPQRETYKHIVLKQKLRREHHLKGTLRKQSNEHQN